jgi:cytochrome c peroxidase
MMNTRNALSATVAASLVAAWCSASGATLTPIEELGKSIFFDENLSIHRNQSCASCHDPAAGWTGPTSDINAHGAVYEGSILGRFGDRKPPSAAYATLSPIFFQDKSGLFVGGNF